MIFRFVHGDVLNDLDNRLNGHCMAILCSLSFCVDLNMFAQYRLASLKLLAQAVTELWAEYPGFNGQNVDGEGQVLLIKIR